MCPGFQNFTTGPNHQSSEISAMMILLEKVEEGDSQGRAGPHLAITSTGVTEESLLEVH